MSENKITQELIDNIFASINGDGSITYCREDLGKIQTFIKEKHGVLLSFSECYTFWTWRSNEMCATFLKVYDDDSEEVNSFFEKWVFVENG